MRIPRSLRDLQVERESRFFDFSFQRLFHGLDLFFGQRRQKLSLRAVVSDAMSSDHEGQGSVQMLMDNRFASSQGGAPSTRSNRGYPATVPSCWRPINSPSAMASGRIGKNCPLAREKSPHPAKWTTSLLISSPARILAVCCTPELLIESSIQITAIRRSFDVPILDVAGSGSGGRVHRHPAQHSRRNSRRALVN